MSFKSGIFVNAVKKSNAYRAILMKAYWGATQTGPKCENV